ncbi:MAG TPA: tryptophan synthase subunit alpha [Armatimonadota bacterium]|jgi:tryptophan synthase alpha chain
MSRITNTFESIHGRGALVAYITAGDPSLEATERLVPQIAAAGADIIELGLPFSDPLLDGTAIQVSAQRALEAGTTPDGVFATVARLRAGGLETPIVLMTCTNLVMRPGFENFAAKCRESGVDGVIVTDLPPEEAGEWKAAADANGVDTIFLLAPTSTNERIEAAAAMATGFIYCVSRAGVTGVQQTVPPELHALLDKIRKHTDTPIAVGFGISTAEHVKTVWQWADGAVVGSAIVNAIAAGEDIPAFITNLRPDLSGN